MLMISSTDLSDPQVLSNPQAPFQSTGFIIISLIVGTLVNLFWGLVQASLYVELRDWKDGPATAKLEQVFG